MALPKHVTPTFVAAALMATFMAAGLLRCPGPPQRGGIRGNVPCTKHGCQLQPAEMHSKCVRPRPRPAPAAIAGRATPPAHVQDQQEAADHALDQGVAAYESGDYAAAARRFEESLQYNPDDEIAQRNLERARQQLAAAWQAARQAQAARDTQAMRDLAAAADQAAPDPPVPTGGRTPAITALELRRTRLRTRIAAIDREVRTLNPTTEFPTIARRGEERVDAVREVATINRSINLTLRAPPPAAPARPR